MPHKAVNSVLRKIPKQATEHTGLALSGKTFGVKDNFASGRTTSASKILTNYTSPFEASVIKLLEKHGGAELTAKLNMDEFGMGSANVNSYFGPTLNPLYEVPHVAGGSSGGSAAAVAEGLVDFALGTDTGGSVRLPASYCGVVGFKPSYGRISRWGVVAYAQTLDTVGILSKDVKLIQQVFKVLDKYDEKDPTSLPEVARSSIDQRLGINDNKKTLRIAIAEQFLIEELSQSNRESLITVLGNLQQINHEIVTVSIPSIVKSVSAYYTIATAEAASNLARYDGIRYGLSQEDENTGDFNELIAKNRSKGLGKEVQKRILLGNYTLSSESGNHYAKATEVRESLVRQFDNVFRVENAITKQFNPDGVDIIISPTTVANVPSMEEYVNQNEANFLQSYANDIMTIPASMAGLPAITIPWNKSSIQVIGQLGDDAKVLEFAQMLQNGSWDV